MSAQSKKILLLLGQAGASYDKLIHEVTVRTAVQAKGLYTIQFGTKREVVNAVCCSHGLRRRLWISGPDYTVCFVHLSSHTRTLAWGVDCK